MSLSNDEISTRVGGMFPKDVMDSLYSIFVEWKTVAWDQSVKNMEEKRSLSSLLDKMSSESVEVNDSFRRYLRSSKRTKYANEAFEEIYDFANMALINMPLVYSNPSANEFPDLHIMLISMAYHYPRYETLFLTPFDLSAIYHDKSEKKKTRSNELDISEVGMDQIRQLIGVEEQVIKPRYDYKRLFEIWIREVKSFDLQQRRRFNDDKLRRQAILGIFNCTFEMIHHDADELIEQDFFSDMDSYINMKTKWRRLMGDSITHSMFLLNEIEEFSLQDFFVAAARKMRNRDARYHGLRRLDEKQTS